MNIQVNCSELVKEKIVKALSSSNINILEDSKIVLVEQGYPQPKNKICIVFNPIEYVEVLELFLRNKDPKNNTNETITGFINNRYVMVKVRKISYFESEGAKVICVSGTDRYVVKETLNYYEALLKQAGFFRANKSQVVNLMNVKEIIPWFNSRLVLALPNKLEIEVSKHYSKALRALLKL